MRLKSLKSCALLAAALIIAGASNAQAQNLTRGIVDNDSWWGTGTSGQSLWLSRTVSSGAKIVQIEVDWSGVEPNAPTSSDPTNPGNSNFNFSAIDPRVRAAVAAGLTPEFLVTGAPLWAEGAGGTASEYEYASYEPDATAYGQFAQTLARRYSGSYDGLPRVRYFEAWGEPNLGVHLAPQWTQVNGKWVNSGTTLYRNMLNAFYSGIKAGNGSDTVILGGLAPYGDHNNNFSPTPGRDTRTPPLNFLENLLCINGSLKRTCNAVTHFDVLAADPYEAPGGNSPGTPAYNTGDISTPDLGQLVRVERGALKLGTLAGRTLKPLWATEFGIDSNPPSLYTGEPPLTQARWEEQSLYVFWTEGVSVALTHLIRDEEPAANPADDSFLSYSGLYYYSGAAKPALTAFQFPFIPHHVGKNTVAWGISPQNGTVTVQRLVGKKWKTVARFAGHSGQVFNHTLGKQPHGTFRALIGRHLSLTYGA